MEGKGGSGERRCCRVLLLLYACCCAYRPLFSFLYLTVMIAFSPAPP